MKTIAQAELERLKRDVSLLKLAEARGIKLKGQGDNLLGLCPFHNDKSPSLVISPSKNIWHCLGACQAGGSVIDWVMRAEKVSFRLAAEMLQKQAPSLAAPRPSSSYQPKLEPVTAPDEPDDVVMRRVVDYYHATLKETPEALAYLAERRGLASAEMVDHFKIGYANRTLGYRLPDMRLKAGATMRQQLIRLGIFRETGHEHFNGNLVVPIFGEDGRVVEMYGRKVREGHQRTDVTKHLYLPHRRGGRGVFNLAAFSASKEIVLCEALIDALTFWCHGIRHVTSAYGVEGFTEELRAVLKSHGTQKLLIAYDRDDAGDKAAAKLAKELGHEGLEIFRVLFPKGMDANEYALKIQPAPKALETVLRCAEWMAGTRPVVVPEALVEPPHDPITGEVLEPQAPSPSLAAPSSAPRVEVELRGEELRVVLGDRSWRVRGLSKNTSYESLRVNLLAAKGEAFFVDTLELYSARQRNTFLKQASEELGAEEQVLKSDLGRIVLKLEDLVHQQIEQALAPKKRVEMSDEDKKAALELLRDPKLLDRVLLDFDRAGVVGEETNKLLGYLAAVSRKLETPLALVIQSSSAAGKSSLMDAVLRLMPEEERIHYSAMTGQSLFYMGETELAHKILAIAEEEGAHSASYALKLLQSEGELTIASTGKDPASGKLVTHEYRVKGPVMIFLTTTAVEVDEELLNRCLVLTVDEGKKQTEAIHERQREAQTLEGVLGRRTRDAVHKLHQNAQRLLEPLIVVNPLARSLRFLSHATRTRRDHMKYLTLIRAIALLHQHQRPIKEAMHETGPVRYIEVSEEDVRIADRLAHGVIKQSLDELPPQTRRLLGLIDELVTAEAKRQGIDKGEVRFSRKDVRRHSGWAHTQLKMHLARLEELEHLLIHGGGARRRIVYELACSYEGNWSGGEAIWSGSGRALVGVGGRPDLVSDSEAKGDLVGVLKKALRAEETKAPTYPQANGRAS